MQWETGNDVRRSPREMKRTIGRIVDVCIWIATVCFALVGGAAVLVFGFLLYAVFQSPDYDKSHPDYARYEGVFARLEKQMYETPRGQQAIDLSQLNDGDWETACIFGGYTDPLEEMQSRGAIVADRDVRRLIEAEELGMRMDQVEEFEIMLTTIDRQNRAHFIHFKHGIGPYGQHLSACTSKPATTVFFNIF